MLVKRFRADPFLYRMNRPWYCAVYTPSPPVGQSLVDKLPKEILAEILHFLPLDELIQSALVCKSFNAAQTESFSRSGAQVEVHQSVFVTDILCSLKVTNFQRFLQSRLGQTITHVNVFCKRTFDNFYHLQFANITQLGLDVSVLQGFGEAFAPKYGSQVESLLVVGIHDSVEGPMPLVAKYFPNVTRLEMDLALGSNIEPLEILQRLQLWNVRVFSKEKDRPPYRIPNNIMSLRDFIIRYEHITELTDVKVECLDGVFAMAPRLEKLTVTNSQEDISEKVLISLLHASRAGHLQQLRHLVLKFHFDSANIWLDLITDLLHTSHLSLESVSVANDIYTDHLGKCLQTQQRLKTFHTTWTVSCVQQLYGYLRNAIQLMFDPESQIRLLSLSLRGLPRCHSLHEVVSKFLRNSGGNGNCEEIGRHVKLLRHSFIRRGGSSDHAETVWLRWAETDVSGAGQNQVAPGYKWIRLILLSS